jgi:hypothetical protein
VLDPGLTDVLRIGFVEAVGVHLEVLHLVRVEPIIEAVFGVDPEAVELSAAAFLSYESNGSGLNI